MYDVIIIGAGPAGVCAAIYAASRSMNTLLLEQEAVGGLLGKVSVVTHYPGIVKDETGATLSARLKEQVASAGVALRLETVTGVQLEGSTKTVTTSAGTYESKTLILANGTHPRTIGIPGEQEFAGRGVSYNATADGAKFRGRNIFVVGGSDGALKETLYLSTLGKTVTLVHFEDRLGAIQEFTERAEHTDNITICLHSRITAIEGGADGVASVTVTDEHTGEAEKRAADGIFLYAGSLPNTDMYQGIPLDGGYIVTDEAMKTSLPGVFAAGDIRVKTVRQASTAVADGTLAALSAKAYLS